MKDDSSSRKGSKRDFFSAISNLENSSPPEEILIELEEEGQSSEVQMEPSEMTLHNLLDEISALEQDDLCKGKEEGII